MQYTEQVKRALKYAKQTAKQCGQSYIGSEHLLMGLMREENGMASAILKECKVDAQKLMELIQELIVPEGMLAERGIMDYSPRATEILAQGEEEAQFFGQEKMGTEHLLLAILKDVDCVATRLLHTNGNTGTEGIYGSIGMSGAGREPLLKNIAYSKKQPGGRSAGRNHAGTVQP